MGFMTQLIRQDRKIEPSVPYLSTVPYMLSQITVKAVHEKTHAYTPIALAIKGIMESP